MQFRANQRSFGGWRYAGCRKYRKMKYKRPAFQPAFASSKPDNYFLAGGAIASFAAFATRNFTTVFALI